MGHWHCFQEPQSLVGREDIEWVVREVPLQRGEGAASRPQRTREILVGRTRQCTRIEKERYRGQSI